MKHSKYKSVICMLTSLLLAIFISVISLAVAIRLGFASNNSLVKALDDVHYYDMVYDSFTEKCESVLIPDGLDVKVLDGAFSKEQLRSDGNDYFKAQLNSTTFNVNTFIYKQKLKDNINQYVNDNNLSVDGDRDKIISDISDEIVNYYLDMIKIPYANTVSVIFRNIIKYFPLIVAPMVVMGAVCVFLLCVQNKRKKNRIFRYLAYSVMSGAITTIIPVIYSFSTGFYKKIQIYPVYVYKFMIRYLENGLKILATVGIMLFIVALIMIFLSTYIKSRYLKEARIHHHHHHHSEDDI